MKNYRKYLVPFILIVLIAIGISRLDIQSVSKHDKSENNTMIAENDNATVNSDKKESVADETSFPDKENNVKESTNKTQKNNGSFDKAKKDGNDKNKKESNNSSEKSNGGLNNKKSSGAKKEIGYEDKGKVSDNKSGERKTDSSNKNKSNNESVKNDKSQNDKSKKDLSQKDSSKNNISPTKTPDNNYIKCNVTIDCSVLLSNMDKLNKNVDKYVPKSGKLVEKTSVKVKKGATAYDILTAVCKEKKIAYDAEYSSIYKTSYVKGIGHIYEKMVGDMSGWLYLVDDVTPNVGASAYILKDGDSVTWTYTCSGRAGS